jgi:hypothetical protein
MSPYLFNLRIHFCTTFTVLHFLLPGFDGTITVQLRQVVLRFIVKSLCRVNSKRLDITSKY